MVLVPACAGLAAWAVAEARRRPPRRVAGRAGAPPSGLVRSPRALVRAALGGRRDAAALPEAVDALAAALRSGRSLVDGLAVAEAGAPPALAAELRAVLGTVGRGLAVGPAIDRWAATTRVEGAALVAAAVGLAGDAGGDVGRALGGVADTLRERRALDRELRALSAQARLSAAVVAVAPLGFAVVAAAADGDTARFLVGSAAGRSCLAVGLALDVLGWRWMRRITGRLA